MVYVEFPRTGCLGARVRHGQGARAGPPEPILNLYVPTTPNPTSGFYLIVPETEVRESQVKVEEAFKTILSLGIAQHPESGMAERRREKLIATNPNAALTTTSSTKWSRPGWS